MGDLSQYDAILLWKAIRNLPKSKIRWGVGVWGCAHNLRHAQRLAVHDTGRGHTPDAQWSAVETVFALCDAGI